MRFKANHLESIAYTVLNVKFQCFTHSQKAFNYTGRKTAFSEQDKMPTKLLTKFFFSRSTIRPTIENLFDMGDANRGLGAVAPTIFSVKLLR